MPNRKSGSRAALALAIAGVVSGFVSPTVLARPAPVAADPGTLQVPFVANTGRYDDAVAYSATTFAGTVFVTRAGEIVHDLAYAAPGRAEPARYTLVESLAGAMPLAPRAADIASARVTRIDGDRADDAATYRRVALGRAWNGVDVWLQAGNNNVEKFFSVEPGASAAAIRVAVRGAQSLAAASDGRLVARTDAGELAFSKPVAYQEIGGERRAVDVAYTVHGNEYGFALGDHDTSRAVVIDPVLQSTFLGGGEFDNTAALAVHPVNGQIYVAGTTQSANFPGTVGGAQRYFGVNGSDFVIARLSSDLTTLLQATYLGRSWQSDDLSAMVIHPQTGDVYVAGTTLDTYFPYAAGGARPANGGGRDAVVSRLSADLTTVYQSTFVGGSRNDYGFLLAIAPDTGDVYLAGDTYSANLPGAAGGAKPTYVVNAQEYGDAFVTRLNPALTTLVQSTYVGGTRGDNVGGNQQFGATRNLAFHPVNGDLYLAGATSSWDFPAIAGIFDTDTWTGAFVTRINPQLSTFVATAWFGGNASETVSALAIDPAGGDVLIAGTTSATTLAGTAGGAQPAPAANPIASGNAYVARISDDLATLRQATFLGGRNYDEARGLAIDPANGDVFVVGRTASTDFPGRFVTPAPAQAAYGGGDYDAFVSRLDASLTTLERSTYLGGASEDRLYCAIVNPFNGELVVAGDTRSTTFPMTAGGARPTHGGSWYDMVLSRLSTDL
ncbi:hypothetical protein [Tahibacter soli]|uniref:DUF7948 domain-containing protein n=1 Tax=Tahibacter soli TaxID=2983605 RepID=A0A9X4BIV6_9GAMM|nr:hypothetical protein [Tahibacter soli]MDC8015675.1 hypothetical protein [Tahibacter soli]